MVTTLGRYSILASELFDAADAFDGFDVSEFVHEPAPVVETKSDQQIVFEYAQTIDRKFVVEDIINGGDFGAMLYDVAASWLPTQTGADFEWLADLARKYARGGGLTDRQAKGVLNCMVGAMRRADNDSMRDVVIRVNEADDERAFNEAFDKWQNDENERKLAESFEKTYGKRYVMNFGAGIGGMIFVNEVGTPRDRWMADAIFVGTNEDAAREELDKANGAQSSGWGTPVADVLMSRVADKRERDAEAAAHAAYLASVVSAGFYTLVRTDGTHRTLKVGKWVADRETNGKMRWISYLRGSDNTSDYQWFAIQTDAGVLRRTRHANDQLMSEAAALLTGDDKTRADAAIAYARESGNCARCNHVLTHPESLETGYGPECIKKVLG
jgi:hypothetical protein